MRRRRRRRRSIARAPALFFAVHRALFFAVHRVHGFERVDRDEHVPGARVDGVRLVPVLEGAEDGRFVEVRHPREVVRAPHRLRVGGKHRAGRERVLARVLASARQPHHHLSHPEPHANHRRLGVQILVDAVVVGEVARERDEHAGPAPEALQRVIGIVPRHRARAPVRDTAAAGCGWGRSRDRGRDIASNGRLFFFALGSSGSSAARSTLENE